MLLVLLLLAAGATADAPPEWLTYRDSDRRFAVALPESPVRTRTSQLTPVGRVHTDLLVSFHEGAEFRVEVHGIPAVARWIVSDQGLLERAADDLLENEGAAYAEASAEPVGQRPGRVVVYRDASGRPGEARFTLADGRLFVLSVLWALSDRDRAGRERFFDSFRLAGEGAASQR
jgi:hypothetical protein